MKITFLGDIMAEPPVLKAAKQKDGSYDFSGVFQHAKPLLAESDLVAGNLETPLAGPEALYTQEHYCFNAPDSYVDACKDAGIGFLSTSNNHTFDRGVEGLKRTVKVMEEKGMPYHGSSLPGTERPEACYLTVGGTTLAIIAYTYGTNWSGTGKKITAEGELAGTVNLLRPQQESVYLPGVFRGKDWMDRLLPKMYQEPRGKIKKALGMCASYPRADDRLDKETAAPYIAQLQADIRKAKEKADLVLFYPHMGGQFALKPGYISQYVAEKALEAGADAVIASHNHSPQRMQYQKGVPVAYSLGNFNMSPRSSLAYPEHMSHQGIAVHLYIEDKKIARVTFSILENHEPRGGQVSGYPVDALYESLPEGKARARLEEDVRKTYGIVTGRVLKAPIIRREYEL